MTSMTSQGQQGFSLAPRNFSEAMEFAKLIASSDLAPKDYKGKPANVLVAVAMGSELGLSPMQSLQNIAVINGRPSVWGDAMLAICRGHRDFVDMIEVMEGTGDDRNAVCTVKRKGQTDVVSQFSVKDAKAAGLWGKDTWSKYADRMLKMRARGFSLRDAFADALRGIISAEEATDIQSHEAVKVVTGNVAQPKTSKRDLILQATDDVIQQETADGPLTIAPTTVDPELRKVAMKRIGSAASVIELESTGEWVKTLSMGDEDTKDVREQYKRKLQFLRSMTDEVADKDVSINELERVPGDD